MSEPGSMVPQPPGKPSLEQIVAQIEAAMAIGQLERARQQLTWAWQAYGGAPALQNLAARLMAPPGEAMPAPPRLPVAPSAGGPPVGAGPPPSPPPAAARPVAVQAPAMPMPAPISPPPPASPPPPRLSPSPLEKTAEMQTMPMPPARPQPTAPPLMAPGPVPSPPLPSPPPAVISPELPTVPMQPPPAPPVAPPPSPVARPVISPDLPTVPMPPPPAPPVAPPPSPIARPAISPELPTLPMPPAPAMPPAPTPPEPSARIEGWIQEAQLMVRAANYDGALELLSRALQVVPNDETLQRHHQLIEKAAQRHRAAIERERDIGKAGRETLTLIQAGELNEARQHLREALLEHGRHPTFDQLQTQLEERQLEQKKEEAGGLLAKARLAYQNGDWQEAQAATEACLLVDPASAEALELRHQAQGQLNQLGREKMQREAVEAAVRDVERLFGGRELQQATQRLAQAIQRLGRHPQFEDLQKRIDAAKSEQQFQLRHDWAERRARELESLIQESVRASLANDFQRAVEKLEAAKKLEPEHPELESKLAIARTLFEKQRAEQKKATELQHALEEIKSQLDAMALDRADMMLQRSAGRFPDAGERFQPLRQRLLHLREAESADLLPNPEDLAKLHRNAETALADRQRALAAAYSWGQAMLFPLRGIGSLLVVFFSLLLVGVDTVVLYQPHLGLLRTGLPLLLFFFTLPLLSATLKGANQPRFGDLKMTGRDVLVGFLGVLLPAVMALPLLLFIMIRGNHHLIDAGAGPLGFFALIALAWLIFPPLVPLLGITAAFGPRHLPRLGRHLRFLGDDGGYPWWVVSTAFGLFLVAFLARLALGPLVPWLGLPIAALLTAYALVGLPHWIGIAVRRRRIELARLYS